MSEPRATDPADNTNPTPAGAASGRIASGSRIARLRIALLPILCLSFLTFGVEGAAAATWDPPAWWEETVLMGTATDDQRYEFADPASCTPRFSSGTVDGTDYHENWSVDNCWRRLDVGWAFCDGYDYTVIPGTDPNTNYGSSHFDYGCEIHLEHDPVNDRYAGDCDRRYGTDDPDDGWRNWIHLDDCRWKVARDLTLGASKTRVQAGDRVVFSGQIDAGDKARCESDQLVKLQRRTAPDQPYKTVPYGTGTTSDSGRYVFRFYLSRTYTYRTRVVESTLCLGDTSNPVRVRVSN